VAREECWPEVRPDPREIRTVQQRVAHSLDDIRGRRDHGERLHPPWQHRRRVVDARDKQHDGLDDVGHLKTLLGPEQRKHGGTDSEADERDRSRREQHERGRDVRVGQIDRHEERDGREDRDAESQRSDERGAAHTHEVREARDRRHER